MYISTGLRSWLQNSKSPQLSFEHHSDKKQQIRTAWTSFSVTNMALLKWNLLCGQKTNMDALGALQELHMRDTNRAFLLSTMPRTGIPWSATCDLHLDSLMQTSNLHFAFATQGNSTTCPADTANSHGVARKFEEALHKVRPTSDLAPQNFHHPKPHFNHASACSTQVLNRTYRNQIFSRLTELTMMLIHGLPNSNSVGLLNSNLKNLTKKKHLAPVLLQNVAFVRWCHVPLICKKSDRSKEQSQRLN